jgi:23S rRNA G2069 N7-methylase RlmK/C1962 C5-methylase RlmI
MIDIAAQAEMLHNRVAKNFRRLQPPFERQNVGAFRVYDWDIPELRLVVDWYEGHLVVAEYARTQTDALPDWLPAMAAACGRALGVPPERIRQKSRRTRPALGERYARQGKGGDRLPVREGPLRFWVNLDDFLDTGLFADHRKTRAMVRADAAGRSLLNLFCYTGSFTCAAASGGARETVSVDTSGIYLDWAKENLALNGCEGAHSLVRSEVRAYLAEARREGRTFDRIVLDPPSYSTPIAAPGSNPTSRRGDEADGDFDLQRDQGSLLRSCLALLAPGGLLWFSTNHQRFEPAFDGLGVRVEELTEATTPPDFRRRPHRCFKLQSEG